MLRHQRCRHGFLDAALLSQAVGKPGAGAAFTRKDEMANENFGLVFVIDQRVGLDAAGNIIAWDYESWSPTRGGRPGYTLPGNHGHGLSSRVSAGAICAAVAGAAADRPVGNGSNAAPSYVIGLVDDAAVELER